MVLYADFFLLMKALHSCHQTLLILFFYFNVLNLAHCVKNKLYLLKYFFELKFFYYLQALKNKRYQPYY